MGRFKTTSLPPSLLQMLLGIVPAVDAETFMRNLNIVRKCFPRLLTEPRVCTAPLCETELIRNYVSCLEQSVDLKGSHYMTSRVYALFNAIDHVTCGRWEAWRAHLGIFFQTPMESSKMDKGPRRFSVGGLTYAFVNSTPEGVNEWGRGASGRVRPVVVEGQTPLYAVVKKVLPDGYTWSDCAIVLHEIEVVRALMAACVPGIMPIEAWFSYPGKRHKAALIMPFGGCAAYFWRALSRPAKLNYMKQVAQTLSAVHGMGRGHGDVKLANVLIDHNEEKAVVIDWAFSRGNGEPLEALSLDPLLQVGGTYYDLQCVRFWKNPSEPVNVLALDVFAWAVMVFAIFSDIFDGRNVNYPPYDDSLMVREAPLSQFLDDAHKQIGRCKKNSDPFVKQLGLLLEGCLADIPGRWTMAMVVDYLQEMTSPSVAAGAGAAAGR